jgi:hypothetical protein
MNLLSVFSMFLPFFSFFVFSCCYHLTVHSFSRFYFLFLFQKLKKMLVPEKKKRRKGGKNPASEARRSILGSKDAGPKMRIRVERGKNRGRRSHQDAHQTHL